MLRSCFFSQDALKGFLDTTAVWNDDKQQFSPQPIITLQSEALDSCLTSGLTLKFDLHLTLTLMSSLTATSRVPDLWLVKVMQNDSALCHINLPGSFNTAPQK